MIEFKREKMQFLPTSCNNDEEPIKEERGEKAPCPCCGNRTIPNDGDALAYICPICFWEIDLFIKSEYEPSDQNHGLTLAEARKKYQRYGVILPYLKKYL